MGQFKVHISWINIKNTYTYSTLLFQLSSTAWNLVFVIYIATALTFSEIQNLVPLRGITNLGALSLISEINTITVALELILCEPRSSAMTVNVSDGFCSRSMACTVAMTPEISSIVKWSAAALCRSEYLTYANNFK